MPRAQPAKATSTKAQGLPSLGQESQGFKSSDRQQTEHPFHIAPPQDDAELARLMKALEPIFNFPLDVAERYARIVGRENFRIIWRDSQGQTQLVGGLALLPMGQYFGGRSVPMHGVAVVGVRPEFRGTGAASALMLHSVRELNAKGVALSTLYPATVPLYRRAGYEPAGARFEIKLSLRMLEITERDYEMRRVEPDGRSTLESLYRTLAPQRAGYLDRSEFIWRRVMSPRGQTTQAFLAINPKTGKPEGYLVYMQTESDEAPYELVCTDFVALTPAAGRRMLTFLADHRSMATTATLHGGSSEPILSLLPERIHKIRLLDHWMLRIVDVAAALSARGYPRALRGELHLDLVDDGIVSNNGRYIVEFADGRASVCTGGNGDLRLDIRGLAALYTGFKSPADLITLGLLSSDNGERAAQAMDIAATAFGGPESCLSDGF